MVQCSFYQRKRVLSVRLSVRLSSTTLYVPMRVAGRSFHPFFSKNGFGTGLAFPLRLGQYYRSRLKQNSLGIYRTCKRRNGPFKRLDNGPHTHTRARELDYQEGKKEGILL